MQLHFTKAQGCANDYILLDCRATGLPDGAAQWSKRLSPRRSAVGADGVICICPPLLAGSDATMRMFNTDGSEGQMCGNGVRCVAQYLYTHGAARPTLHIDTVAAGSKTLLRLGEGLWQADMGRFSAMAADLPAVGLGAGPLIRQPLTAAGRTWEVSCISMGNPHCVVQWPDGAVPTGPVLAGLGPALEHHPAFPQRTNVEFVFVQGAARLVMRVWERGCGETWACGTGACAAVAAMVLRGLCPRGTPVEVSLPGGELAVTVLRDDTVLLAGPAQLVYEGVAEL